MKYWGKNPSYSVFVHFAGGLGVGLLLYPSLPADSVYTWSWVLVAIWVIGHLWALVASQ